MALHYIIDGYNVIKQVPAWSNCELKEARDSFLKFIQINKIAGSVRNKITVVFDGKNNYAFSSSSRVQLSRESVIDIVFSKSITADEQIIEIIKLIKNPRNVVLVSDDKQLRISGRSYGAQLMSVADFLKRGRQDKTKVCDSGKCGLSAHQARKITQELEKIWLKEK